MPAARRASVGIGQTRVTRSVRLVQAGATRDASRPDRSRANREPRTATAFQRPAHQRHVPSPRRAARPCRCSPGREAPCPDNLLGFVPRRTPPRPPGAASPAAPRARPAWPRARRTRSRSPRRHRAGRARARAGQRGDHAPRRRPHATRARQSSAHASPTTNATHQTTRRTASCSARRAGGCCLSRARPGPLSLGRGLG